MMTRDTAVLLLEQVVKKPKLRLPDNEFQAIEFALNKLRNVKCFCDICGEETYDGYMIDNRIWDLVHPQGYQGYLHLKCLYEQLGIGPKLEHFPDVPINQQLRFLLT